MRGWRRLVWAAWWLQYAAGRLELGARRLVARFLRTTEPDCRAKHGAS